MKLVLFIKGERGKFNNKFKKKDYKTLISMGIRPKALEEINKLRSQLIAILNTSNSLKEKLPNEFRMQPPNQQQLRKLR